jgi:cytoskeletal protein RodZ
MSFSLSGGAPLRIAAIVGAFVVLGGGYFVFGPGKPKPATTEHRLIRHPHGLQSSGRKTVATKKAASARTKPKTSASKPAKHGTAPGTTSKATAKPKAVAKAAPKPVAKPKPTPVRLVAGLPVELAAALEQHGVVVVSIYNPRANDDRIAVAEASAGAALAGVGFAGLSVLDQDQIGGVTRAVGVLDSPAVLIYQRPGRVIGQLHGFADRETVAQAVANVTSGH